MEQARVLASRWSAPLPTGSAYLADLPGGPDTLLFTNRHGGPLRYNQWRKAHFDPAVSAAGLDDVTLHDLRASHGTWVADRYGVMTAAHRLGHSNASVTTRHYARPVAGRDVEVAQAADAWLAGHDRAEVARTWHDDPRREDETDSLEP